MTWIEFFILFFRWASLRGPELAKKVQPYAQGLWKKILRFIEILLLIPFIAFLFAFAFRTPWLTALISLPLIVVLFLAMIQRTYLAALIGFAWGAYRLRERATDDLVKAGKLFLDFCLGILLWELILLLYISHVPVWRQPSRLPLIALYATLLATILIYFGIKSKWFWRLLRLFLVFALIWQTICLFMPETSKTILGLIPSDRKISQGIKLTFTPLPKPPQPKPTVKPTQRTTLNPTPQKITISPGQKIPTGFSCPPDEKPCLDITVLNGDYSNLFLFASANDRSEYRMKCPSDTIWALRSEPIINLYLENRGKKDITVRISPLRLR